jgi:hypothetical protein
MQVDICVKPKNVALYIIDEFISTIKSVDPNAESGLSKVVVPTLQSVKEIVEETDENVADWDIVVSVVIVLIYSHTVSVLYDNAPKTCLQALIDWLKLSKGTVLEGYAKTVAKHLGLPIEI